MSFFRKTTSVARSSGSESPATRLLSARSNRSYYGSTDPKGSNSIKNSRATNPTSHSSSEILKSKSHAVANEIKSSNVASNKLDKLGMFDGVFIPTTLNVLSILMFLRFGFIVGQLGILGSLITLILCYTINLLTTLSVSAIATNGIVRNGGAYYMISRSLGPEFGGAIGLIFFFGLILNSALNVVGLIEPLYSNFGQIHGRIFHFFPEGGLWDITYLTIVLFICLAISLVGAGMVSKTAMLLLCMLLTSIASIPISSFFVKPFELPDINSHYSGISWNTFIHNILPHFTKDAAGSQTHSTENFSNLFGIFFPATAGILAGASMSGSLKNPSKSIPKGTLWGLMLTFICYGTVIMSLGISVPRDLLYKDVTVIQTINLYEGIIVLGEFSTALFSIISGLISAAEILAAISKDAIIPGLSIFAASPNANPILAILVSWFLTQLFLFSNINQIATLITMAFLMTFIVINFACFLLEISAAPNFRPSFGYFNRSTAFGGILACLIAMFIVDGLSASMIITSLFILIIVIHYVCPPKSWGDVSQTLIYHQVRKYLFKIRQDNVKYWRPQILLLVDDPRNCWNLMKFCNNLKKGGLYVLGHVIVASNDFGSNYEQYENERTSWVKLRDNLKLKAFVQFSFSLSLTWGVRNIYLGSGLGNMKPNIIVLGFIDLRNRKISANTSSAELKDSHFFPSNIEKFNPEYSKQPDIPGLAFPTDCYKKDDKRIKVTEWVQCIEELLLMNANVAIAKGFPRLEVPDKNTPELSNFEKKIIDLYPIQMSAEIEQESGQTILSSNFDTYTLILQLGAILTTVPQWNRTHTLRIVVFVENTDDTEEERQRVIQFLDVLRINADVLVLSFNSGKFSFYDCIVKNTFTDKKVFKRVNKMLNNDPWWKAITDIRNSENKSSHNCNEDLFATGIAPNTSSTSNSPGKLQFDLDQNKKNIALADLQRLGASFKMRTNKLENSKIIPNFIYDSSSDSDDFSDFETTGYDSDPETILRKRERRRQKSSFGLLNYSNGKSNSKRLDESLLATKQRRKTFTGFIQADSQHGQNTLLNHKQHLIRTPITPKSPFFESRNMSSNVPVFALEDSANLNSLNNNNNEVNSTTHMPSLSRQSSIHSYTSIISQARPNFTSQQIPKSKVNEDACGNEPTIMFAKDDEDNDMSSVKTFKGLKKSYISNVSKKDKFKDLPALDTKSNKTSNIDSISNEKESSFNMKNGIRLSEQDKYEEKDIAANSPKTRYETEMSLSSANSFNLASDKDMNAPFNPATKPDSLEFECVNDGYESSSSDTSKSSAKSRMRDINNLTFNDVSARAQHLILNQLMLHTSRNSSIIFSTLPPPPPGCYRSKKDSLDYVETLDLWCNGLPPTLLINAKTMTVTTAL